jgi:Holliday junction resolvase-like predicted endonuclease
MAVEDLEISVETAVVAAALAAGWFVRKVKWLCRKGAPDRIFAKGGRLVFIEFKRPSGGRRSAHQKREIRLLEAAGIEAYFCSSAEEAYEILGL